MNDNTTNIMGFKQDFASVDLILDSTIETRGVDAFILSLIKAEKQMRRIFTFLIYQHPSYTRANYLELRKALADNKGVYFEGFVKGIDLILPRKIEEIYGAEYHEDISDLLVFTNERNKIFHGQITANGLSRKDLIKRVNHIRKWCESLGDRLKSEIGYDGFSDSFHKSTLKLALNNQDKFDTIDNYKEFIKNNIQRKGNQTKKKPSPLNIIPET